MVPKYRREEERIRMSRLCFLYLKTYLFLAAQATSLVNTVSFFHIQSVNYPWSFYNILWINIRDLKINLFWKPVWPCAFCFLWTRTKGLFHFSPDRNPLRRGTNSQVNHNTFNKDFALAHCPSSIQGLGLNGNKNVCFFLTIKKRKHYLQLSLHKKCAAISHFLMKTHYHKINSTHHSK